MRKNTKVKEEDYLHHTGDKGFKVVMKVKIL
jgi:hypothetical protein